MPLYMDVHRGMHGIDEAKMAAAHQKDLQHQAKHGVQFQSYWFDAEKETVFCLSQAPDAKAAEAVHKLAGHPADEIFMVHQGS